MFSLDDRRRAASGGWLPLAVAGVLVLAGCSGADDPGADAAESPSASSSPSQSESPSPSPSAVYKPASAEGPAENVPLPVMPEEAKVESKEGLIAFARYWYDLANYGYETGDVEPLKAVSGPDCTDCTRYLDVVADGFTGSDWISGAKINFQDADSAYVLTPEGDYQVLIQFTQDPLEFRGPDGKVYETHPGSSKPVAQIMEAKFLAGQWFVEQLSSM